MADREAVSEALDALVEEYVGLHGDMAAAHAAMETAQRDGYLALSKARVSMGVHAITSLQYPDRIDPIVTVRVDTGASVDKIFAVGGGETPEPKETAAPGLRKRVGGKAGGDDAAAAAAAATKSKTTTAVGQGAPADPVRWFGLLSPRPLKHSQAKFQAMVQRAVAVAGIRCRMAVVRAEYARLLEEKSKREAEESMLSID